MIESQQAATAVPTYEASHALQLARDKQNLLLAAIGGTATAFGSAAVWAAFTHLTSRQIGYMAIGVGYLVGLAVRKLGNGVDLSFGVLGATLALFGCLFGNLLVGVVSLASYHEVSVTQAFASVDFRIAGNLMKATFQPMDLLFYGLAVFAGFRYSRETTSTTSKPIAV